MSDLKLRAASSPSEYSEQFIQGMLDRMAVSEHKYGLIAAAYPDKVDAISSLMTRLRLYARGDATKGIPPGNTEYLIDAANFAMIEFMHPRHAEAHFQPTDDSGSPGRTRLGGGADMRDNASI